MKKSLIIISFLLVVFFAPSVFAQQEESQLVYAIKHKVKPEKMEDYKDLMKELVSSLKEHNYPFMISSWQSSYPYFYYFFPVKDYNMAEEVIKEQWKIIPNLEGWAKSLFGAVESWDAFFIKSIDSLAYQPETRVDGLVYAEWWIEYYKPWNGLKYRNAFKRANEMDKKGGFDYPIHRWQGDIGMNGPAIITVFWGKNPADLYAHASKDWEMLGEEVREMIQDFSSTTRKFEKIPFWLQKELSYTPEE